MEEKCTEVQLWNTVFYCSVLLFARDLTQSMVYPRQVSQVEDVVEFGGCGWERLNDVLVYSHRALRDLSRAAKNIDATNVFDPIALQL